MALTLHLHPLSSFCWKVLIALYENGTPFEPRMVDFGDPTARAAYAALWPTCKIPLLEDDGRVVPETSIMIEYLDRHHPGALKLLPADAPAQMEVRLWDRLSDLYVMDPMQRIVGQHMRPEAERDAATLASCQTLLDRSYDMIERHMAEQHAAGRHWAAGENFSMADCAAAPALFYAAIARPFPPGHGALQSYYERLMTRPSVERAIDEARPYFRYFPLRDALPARFRDGAAA